MLTVLLTLLLPITLAEFNGGPYISLSNGRKLPQIGFGTWQASGDTLKLALRKALDVGYRLIDTATLYNNSVDIGEVLQEYFSDGRLKREDIFVTTKLWADELNPSLTVQNAKESLKQLNLDYVDLLLVHLPAAFKTNMSAQDHSLTIVDIWKGFEDVYEKGLAKSIGLSNVNEEQIERVMKTARVPVHNVQIEMNLYLPQKEMVSFCKSKNISVTAYAPLGSPATFEQARWEHAEPLKDKNVQALAAKLGKTPAQIILRYLLQRGVAIIPKSVTPERIASNFKVTDFTLSKDEVELLESANKHLRNFWHGYAAGHPEDPFKTERLQF